MQGLATLVKFLGDQRSEAFRDFPLQSKGYIITYCVFYPKKEAQCLFQFWRQHILYMSMQERPLQQVQAMMQAALFLGLHDLVNYIAVEVHVE